MKLPNLNIPEFSDRNYRLASYVATGIVALASAFLIYEMFANADLRIKPQWNMFKSWLMGPLFIVGFVISVLHLGKNHYSYDYYEQEYDSCGNKIGKPKKSYDVIDTVEGNCLVPLAMHFIVEPMLWAALIYYPLMCVVAILGALVPYILAIVIIALCYLVFMFPTKCNFRYHSAALVAFSVLLTGIFVFGGYSIQSMASGSSAPVQNNSIEENPAMNEVDDSTIENEGNSEADTEEGENDWQTFELNSGVKTCEWHMGWSEQTVTYGFNENGGWTTYNGNPLAKASVYSVKRDGTHRITQYTEGENDMIDTFGFEFDESGRVVKKTDDSPDGNGVTTYEYNEQGLIVKTTYVGTESGMGAETSDTQDVQLITEYTYDEVDDHGNWTKRSYKRSDGATGTDTRVITYY